MVRVKFTLTEIREYSWCKDGKRLVFSPQYDTSIAEDQRFAKASPSGEFQIHVDNPAALAQMEIGKAYYFDISPVDPPAATGSGSQS